MKVGRVIKIKGRRIMIERRRRGRRMMKTRRRG